MRRICLFLIAISLPLSIAAQGRYWIPVAAHSEGVGGSAWRTDVGILNPQQGPASVEVRLRDGANVWTMAVTVPGGAERVLQDVVDQLVGGANGALRIKRQPRVNLSGNTTRDDVQNIDPEIDCQLFQCLSRLCIQVCRLRFACPHCRAHEFLVLGLLSGFQEQ